MAQFAWVAATGVALVALAVPVQPAAGAEPRRVDLRGRYVVVHADARLNESVRRYLRVGDRYLRLRFRREPAIRPQSRIEVMGTLAGAVLAVTDVDVTAPASAVETTGSERLLVIRARWGTTTLRSSRDATESFLFGADPRSTAQWYRSASYGHLAVTGDVTTDLTIPDPLSCNLYRIAADTTDAARVAGYAVDSYSKVMFNAPSGYCNSAGYGEVGGRYSWIFDGLSNLADGYERLVPAHELGHNLGRSHSHGLECGAVTVSLGCLTTSSSNNEYGNAYDVMGNNWPGNSAGAVAMFSAKPLIDLGWFAGRAETVTTSGRYRIAPLELMDANAPQALVIDTGKRRYYVELRRPLGVDAFLTGYPQATNGIQVNMRNDLPQGDNGPLNLDFAPGSDACAYCDFFDSSLSPGQTYEDVSGAFRMAVESVTDEAAPVSIEFGDFAAPETTIESALSGFVNHSDATFAFSASEPGATFECRLDAEAFAPCSSPLALSGLGDGPHTFTVRAIDAVGHVDRTPADSSFTVDTRLPTVAITAPLAATTLTGTVTLGAAASDIYGIVRVKWFLDGVQIASDSTSESWSKPWNSATVADGAHRLLAKARDAAGNWGTSRSITFATSNTDG